MNLFRMAFTVFKSIFSGPSTLMYPVKPRIYSPITRGKIEIEISRCIFCGMCSRKCPTGSITVTRDKHEWSIDRLYCITCGACVEACPVKCLSMHNSYSPSVTSRNMAVYTAVAAPVRPPE